jgi:hypothetical protein
MTARDWRNELPPHCPHPLKSGSICTACVQGVIERLLAHGDTLEREALADYRRMWADRDARDATLARLRELVKAWREREQRFCRQADGQGQTYYAEQLAAKADGVGTCADELEAALAASSAPETEATR